MESPAWIGVELGSWCLYLTLHGESAYAASPSSIISVGDAVSRYSITLAHGPDIGSGPSHTHTPPRERTAVRTTLVFFFFPVRRRQQVPTRQRDVAAAAVQSNAVPQCDSHRPATPHRNGHSGSIDQREEAKRGVDMSKAFHSGGMHHTPRAQQQALAARPPAVQGAP